MGAMAYPGQLVTGLGRFRALTELEEIAQSVRMILLTQRGERPFRPDFGTRLNTFAFEQMDTTTSTLIRQEVVSALQTWEPRIWNIEVSFDSQAQQGQLIVNVQYEVRSSGVQGSVQVTQTMA